YRITHVMALLFIAHRNTSFWPIVPIIPHYSCKHYLEKEQERIKVYLEHLFGDYSAEIEGDSTFRTAEVYSPEGELIASYSSFYGQWTTHQTKAEFNFITETDMIYLQAFREARAEMKAAAQGQAPTDATTVDIRA
ncbi:hypothetical protein H6B69_19260, partial [Pseudoflavonifractor phocaeensis]|nr:hypothetical protein [Pseudoflavonifractor phocaeensis]